MTHDASGSTLRKGGLSGGCLDMSKVPTHVVSGGRLVCPWESRPVPPTSGLSHGSLNVCAVSVDMACLTIPSNVLDMYVVYMSVWAATEASSRVWHALVSVDVMDEVQPCNQWPRVLYMSSHVCSPSNIQAHIHSRSTDQSVSHVPIAVPSCTARLCMSSHVYTPLNVQAHIHPASTVQNVSHV